jgi:hypothetical protein
LDDAADALDRAAGNIARTACTRPEAPRPASSCPVGLLPRSYAFRSAGRWEAAAWTQARPPEQYPFASRKRGWPRRRPRRVPRLGQQRWQGLWPARKPRHRRRGGSGCRSEGLQRGQRPQRGPEVRKSPQRKPRAAPRLQVPLRAAVQARRLPLKSAKAFRQEQSSSAKAPGPMRAHSPARAGTLSPPPSPDRFPAEPGPESPSEPGGASSRSEPQRLGAPEGFSLVRTLPGSSLPPSGLRSRRLRAVQSRRVPLQLSCLFKIAYIRI